MPQVMPPHPWNPRLPYRRPKPSLQVRNIGRGGGVLGGEDPFRPLPAIHVPQDGLGFFVQWGILHPTSFGLGQGNEPHLKIHVGPFHGQWLALPKSREDSEPNPWGISRPNGHRIRGTQYLISASLCDLGHHLRWHDWGVVVPGNSASCHPAWHEADADVFGETDYDAPLLFLAARFRSGRNVWQG